MKHRLSPWWYWRSARIPRRVGRGPIHSKYLRHFPNFVKALGGKAFAHRSAYYVHGYAGAAMWLPPEVSPDEDTPVDLLQHTGHAPVQKDVFAVFEQMARYHPQEPHWFCRSLGSIRFNRARGAARP